LPLDSDQRRCVRVEKRKINGRDPGKTDQVPLAWFHHPEQATGKYRGDGRKSLREQGGWRGELRKLNGAGKYRDTHDRNNVQLQWMAILFQGLVLAPPGEDIHNQAREAEYEQ
jgi:hypothetical protein